MSKPALSEFLEGVKARCEKATKGPWDSTFEANVQGKPRRSIWARYYPDQLPQDQRLAILPHPHPGWWVAETRIAEEDNGPQDANFIAHARADIEVLVKMVECVLEDHPCIGPPGCMERDLEVLVPEKKP